MFFSLLRSASPSKYRSEPELIRGGDGGFEFGDEAVGVAVAMAHREVAERYRRGILLAVLAHAMPEQHGKYFGVVVQ